MPLTDPQTFHCSRARDHSHFYIRFQTLNAPFNLSVEWLPAAAYPFHNIRAEGLPLLAAPGTGFVASYPPINNALNPYFPVIPVLFLCLFLYLCLSPMS